MIGTFILLCRIFCDITTIVEDAGVFTTTLVQAEGENDFFNLNIVQLIETQKNGSSINIFENC